MFTSDSVSAQHSHSDDDSSVSPSHASQSSIGTRKAKKDVIRTPFSEIECDVVYPENNPEFAISDISTVLSAVGVFDGFKKE